MYKYKIGDHVIVEEDNIGGHYAGKTGVIDDIWPRPHAHQYRVKFDDNPNAQIWCKVKCLVGKPIDIKNGKVKCVGYSASERGFTIGKVYEVVNNTITNDRGFKYRHLDMSKKESIIEWLNPWYKFELVPNEKIIITHDYKTTTATLYRGDETVVATARCAPEDKFDFMVGAKLAMERLDAEINKPKYYNGKVVCVDNKRNPSKYTVGKVYEFVDGLLTDNFGVATPWAGHRMTSFEEWSKWTTSKFIPLVED